MNNYPHKRHNIMGSIFPHQSNMVHDPCKCHVGIDSTFFTNSTWHHNFYLGHLVVTKLQSFSFVGVHMALPIMPCHVPTIDATCLLDFPLENRASCKCLLQLENPIARLVTKPWFFPSGCWCCSLAIKTKQLSIGIHLNNAWTYIDVVKWKLLDFFLEIKAYMWPMYIFLEKFGSFSKRKNPPLNTT